MAIVWGLFVCISFDFQTRFNGTDATCAALSWWLPHHDARMQGSF